MQKIGAKNWGKFVKKSRKNREKNWCKKLGKICEKIGEKICKKIDLHLIIYSLCKPIYRSNNDTNVEFLWK